MAVSLATTPNIASDLFNARSFLYSLWDAQRWTRRAQLLDEAVAADRSALEVRTKVTPCFFSAIMTKRLPSIANTGTNRCLAKPLAKSL
jgi:hypothetical protein